MTFGWSPLWYRATIHWRMISARFGDFFDPDLAHALVFCGVVGDIHFFSTTHEKDEHVFHNCQKSGTCYFDSGICSVK